MRTAVVDGQLGLVADVGLAAHDAHNDASALGRELHGVAEQVDYYLLGVDGVQPHGGRMGVALGEQAHAARHGGALEGGGQRGGVGHQVHRSAVESQLSAVDAAHVGDLVHHAQHALAVALHDLVVLGSLGVVGTRHQLLQRRDYHGEGRAQLMSYAGEEAQLGLLGLGGVAALAQALVGYAASAVVAPHEPGRQQGQGHVDEACPPRGPQLGGDVDVEDGLGGQRVGLVLEGGAHAQAVVAGLEVGVVGLGVVPRGGVPVLLVALKTVGVDDARGVSQLRGAEEGREGVPAARQAHAGGREYALVQGAVGVGGIIDHVVRTYAQGREVHLAHALGAL